LSTLSLGGEEEEEEEFIRILMDTVERERESSMDTVERPRAPLGDEGTAGRHVAAHLSTLSLGDKETAGSEGLIRI
jgi:hypothetical protein